MKSVKSSSQKGIVPLLSDMRIVLLGGRRMGKSSSGNTILGREEFDTSIRTAECVKREGDAQQTGRHITLVEVPGWWNNYTIKQTPEGDKREIVLSASLCPPGPHALLLAIRIDMKFEEAIKKTVQEHLELLGERVWDHTILLFTYGDKLGHKSVEQHIQAGGKALQWVVEKCGNRYHVIDNKKSGGGQVTELLEKIEEMVAGNRGQLFDFDQNKLTKLMEKKREENRRAEERKRKVRKQRETLRSSAGVVPHISDMRIVLLGHRVGGKSSSGNTILGRQVFDTSGRTAECVKREGDTAGRHITLVEAPGWWKNYTVDKTPEGDKQEIVRSLSLCHPGPHALLLLINVSETFTDTHKQAVQEHMELLGERVWNNTIVLFTYGEWLGNTSIEQHIESGGEALQWIAQKCGNRHVAFDNKRSDGSQVTELLEKIEEMVVGNGDSLQNFPGIQARSRDRPPTIASSDSGFPSVDSNAEDELKSLSFPVKMAIHERKMNKVASSDSGFPFLDSNAENELKSLSFPDKMAVQLEKVNIAIPSRIARKIPLVSDDAIQVNQEDFIGEGAFGKVYRGAYEGTPVAVKTMAMGGCPQDSLEIIIPLCLSHPHIVRMMAVSTREHDIRIAYEYIHGANLKQILHTSECRVKLDKEDKMFVALEIGMAVAYIHGTHVIHQDIKPANIMISERTKTAYLTDWGLANMKDSMAQFGASSPGQYRGPRVAGTELYMAPELFMHNSHCSKRSDMWSLGLTYLEMFTGCVPWTLHNRAALTGMLSRQEPPHALAKLQPHLKDVVEHLLEYDPESRMSAKEMVAYLKSEVDLVKRYGYEW